MKIAFTSKGTNWKSKIDRRFGRTDYILVYDTETKALTSVNNKATADEAHGVGPKTAQKVHDEKVEVLITGTGPGENAARVLKTAEIKVYTGAEKMNVKQALEAFEQNQLSAFN